MKNKPHKIDGEKAEKVITTLLQKLEAELVMAQHRKELADRLTLYYDKESNKFFSKMRALKKRISLC